MSAPSPRPLELLAPARDRETAVAAIDCGADAVYIGGPHHGARAAASNSIEDIRFVCQYAHRFRAKVYVTLNTLIYDNEIDDVRRAVADLHAAGVDALIVQDLGLLRMDLPPIPLHASTQCDTRTPGRARFLEQLGMDCIVLPREMSLDEIRSVADAVSVRLEGFVHGALCVCYSGDCRASLLNGGRSANRGECAQICRLPYNLTDASGRVIVANRHLLSLKDLNRLDRLADMADAGISSFKIEGRLKSHLYVMNTVLAYSRALDAVCAANPDKYCRASVGRVNADFEPDVNLSFNRGFTPYYIDGRQSIRPASLSQPLTPKWAGAPVGRVKAVRGRQLTVDSKAVFQPGDGLSYFDADGRFCGFRVNTVNGNVLGLSAPVAIKPGTHIFRNYNKAFEDRLNASRTERRIPVSMTLRSIPGGIALAMSCARGCRVESTVQCNLDAARTPQLQARRNALSKLGDTVYILDNYTDDLGDVFVPASVLSALRRRTVAMLDHAAEATRIPARRSPEQADAVWPEGDSLSFHSNVSNRLASQLYRDHGVKSIEAALEVAPPSPEQETRVMSSRFCLRRELRACLRTPSGSKLPRELYLDQADGRIRRMRIDCDCANCIMHLTALPADKSSKK